MKEKVTIKLTADQRVMAQEQSKDIFGKSNVSAYYGYLLEKINKRKYNTLKNKQDGK